MPEIEELAQEELRIGGLRINPATNGPSRTSYYNGLRLLDRVSGSETTVAGLPENPRIGDIDWSGDGRYIAFTHTVSDGIQLWLIDVEQAAARQLTQAVINDAMRGRPYEWLSDNQTLVYKTILPNRGDPPAKPSVPAGPVIRESTGQEAPARTYQDLLENPHDEALFEYYTSAQLMKLDLEEGVRRPLGRAGIIAGFEPSPDARYIMRTTIEKPFSYLVPYYRFPEKVDLIDLEGNLVRNLAEIPLTESMPKGFDAVREGPRNFNWRADVPATVYWVEAQDGGDPKAEVDVRDRLYHLSAPFEGEAEEDIDFRLRYGGITWGDGGLAIAYERMWSTRQLITSRWAPEHADGSKQVLFDRSYEDRYNDPGSFETTLNRYGRRVLLTSDGGASLFLTGQGASPEGNRPFIDRYDLESGQTERLWRSEAPYYEYPVAVVDAGEGKLLTRRESKTDPPNYYLRDWQDGSLQPVTRFENPYEEIEGISSEFVKYEREDGIELTATLYLPAGYQAERDGPLPVFMWAYPREFKSADAAGQVSGSPYRFPRISGSSRILWATQGYAVLDNASMPVVGEGDEQPNDSFVEQLRMNARAAINKLEAMGVGDPGRVALGGHSYGAFMTANLLAHSDLFAAGIARSGAYNRSLTPFGFQREERTFWEAPEIYFQMSPFMHAHKVNEPILLIHGQADNNSGTFPMQSERFYAALKGHGTLVRLVMLPHESHGYRARESVMHTLWEMNRWLDKYVKNKEQEKGE
ncbi:MAG: prolyl oligopeptidase family serine peptidase, partial [Saprospiraceae bacterium]|nr:prolyl oligopeptidase family serine peptidase [Saprospiraceae bacterium]